MLINVKNKQRILSKLGIEKLNPMQLEAQTAFSALQDIVLLSPTGTGKTLAFLLPIIESLNPSSTEVQALIIVPTRELAIQIEQVMREMGSGYKVNTIYGGRARFKDKIDLKHRPAILVGTPGRVADHMKRASFSTDDIKTLVLDEFDKSLEVGFETEMIEIIEDLQSAERKILTSATQKLEIPKFIKLNNPIRINFLKGKNDQLGIKTVLSQSKDKLETLIALLDHIGNQPGIIFCNFKDTIQMVSDYLTKQRISHSCFYGTLEQKDRERALIKFRNGTSQLLLATDLAARGIDVPELKFIIHYQLPPRKEEFTHRNGRTARMDKAGTAYVVHGKTEKLPDFIKQNPINNLATDSSRATINWTTLFISGGRRDKISKGDIAGLFFKQGQLNEDQIGTIELKQDCAFVAVETSIAQSIIDQFNNTRLKKKKVRISFA